MMMRQIIIIEVCVFILLLLRHTHMCYFVIKTATTQKRGKNWIRKQRKVAGESVNTQSKNIQLGLLIKKTQYAHHLHHSHCDFNILLCKYTLHSPGNNC